MFLSVPTHFSNSDVRFASLIVEAITFVSLIYSIYSKKSVQIRFGYVSQ